MSVQRTFNKIFKTRGEVKKLNINKSNKKSAIFKIKPMNFFKTFNEWLKLFRKILKIVLFRTYL